jgi:hypothetical protein
MKITNKDITILLIFLIGLSSISSTSLSIQSNKRTFSRRKSEIKTKLTSTEAAEVVLQKMKTELTDPVNIAFFIMGMLSNWFPKIEDLYLKIKHLVFFFNPCYKAIKQAWEMIHGTSQETDQSKKENHDREQSEVLVNIASEENKLNEFETKDDQATPEERTQLCEKTKKIVHKIWRLTLDANDSLSKNYRDSTDRGSDSITAQDYCGYPSIVRYDNKKALKLMNENFDSPEHFYSVCMNIRENMDCGNYRPDNKGAWYFLKKIPKYGLLVLKGGFCVVHLLKVGGHDPASGTPKNEEISSIASTAVGTVEIAKLIFSQIGSLLLHIVSFGIYGALKAAWNIIKLVFKIYVLISHLLFDIPFKLGSIVGLGLKTISTLIKGARRRRRMK